MPEPRYRARGLSVSRTQVTNESDINRGFVLVHMQKENVQRIALI